MQMIANSLIAASLYTGIGLSFWLIYRSAGFFHFAHGATITFGAYACYCATSLGVPLWGSMVLATTLSAGLGALMHVGVFRPLIRRGAGAQVLLLASLGLYIVIENSLAMVFGNGPKSLRDGVVREGLDVLGARLTPPQLSLIGFAVAAFLVTWFCLRFSRVGLKLRAVASDSELAEASGLSADSVMLRAAVAGSALAGLFGVLLALDLDLTPGMGLHPLMMGIVVVIISGVDRIAGIMLGALLLGLIRNLGVWLISSQWQDATVFAVLVAFLLCRPQGIAGERPVKTSINRAIK